MSIKKILLPSLLTITLFSSGIAIANNIDANKQTPKCSKHKNQVKFFKSLNVKQRQQIKQIRQSHRGEFKPLRQQMRVLHKQLRATYKLDNPSWLSIKSLVEKKSQVKAKLALLKAKVRFEVFQKTGIKLPSRKHHLCKKVKKYKVKN